MIIGQTFKAKDGAYCRTFSAGATAGLACHEGQAWTVRVAVPAGPNAARTVQDVVAATIDGAPLTAKAEAQARSHGWQ